MIIWIYLGNAWFTFLFPLKGHGNEADFPSLLHKSVQHWSLTLHFELFRFWLQICRDIPNQKKTLQVGESTTLRLTEEGSFLLNIQKPTLWLAGSPSQGVADSPTRRVGESTTLRLTEEGSFILNIQKPSLWLAKSNSRFGVSGSRYSKFFKFIIDLQNFKQLNQPFKGPILQKIGQGYI